MSRSRSDRVAAYVDSPALAKRIRFGPDLACEVSGSLGIYQTRASVRQRGESSCTCPSEIVPCKHVDALRETYKVRPTSFVEAEPLLAKFATRSKEQMVAQIRTATLASPSILSALGLVEFEEADEFLDD